MEAGATYIATASTSTSRAADRGPAIPPDRTRRGEEDMRFGGDSLREEGCGRVSRLYGGVPWRRVGERCRVMSLDR